MGETSQKKRRFSVNGDWKEERKVEINPSWIIQTLILCLLGVSGFFITSQLNNISEEISLSRIERAQLRADLSALEVGLRGDRFSRSDWERESRKLEDALREIQERLRALENGK